ncbi:MAG: hypothetical protein J3K34DRAFT_41153 [Monoraphidium minutum]|nr:MAG: hypothetical protein J3K34DRAFT_41153 [Monoraphidium minutum]
MEAALRPLQGPRTCCYARQGWKEPMRTPRLARPTRPCTSHAVQPARPRPQQPAAAAAKGGRTHRCRSIPPRRRLRGGGATRHRGRGGGRGAAAAVADGGGGAGAGGRGGGGRALLAAPGAGAAPHARRDRGRRAQPAGRVPRHRAHVRAAAARGAAAADIGGRGDRRGQRGSGPT